MRRRPETFPDRDPIVLLTACASAASFLVYYFRHEVLLYGDTVAHINVARRAFDSLTPGPLQLGTVWLPLPHILTIPFIVSNWMWRTGVGGSMVSMIAFVAGALGVYRLVRGSGEAGRAAGWLGVAMYAANPNLLYLQSTAMTEALYLALFVWAVVYARDFVRNWKRDPANAPARLERCALLLGGAMLTRYDGWFLAGCIFLVLLGTVVKRVVRHQEHPPVLPEYGLRMRRAARNFVLLLAALAGLWLAFNYREFGNGLEFANGPYSARAIERRSAEATDSHHPGYGDLRVAGEYLLKALELNLGSRLWGTAMLLAALVGVALALQLARRFAILLLLWAPLPFYALSIAYGGVPVFIPAWWPFSYYNVRYGLELLPAVAVFVALGFDLLTKRAHDLRWRAAVIAGTVIVVGGSAYSLWRTTPICLLEARANGSARQNFEIALAAELERLPKSSRLLMYSGDYPGALQRAGILLRRVRNETNHPQWEQALAAPAREADYVIAIDDDTVAEAVASHPADLDPLAQVETPHQPRTTVYKSVLRAGR